MVDFNIENYLRISWQDVLLVCISSFIIVAVCKHFFWNKLLDFVAKRQALIQKNIDDSEQIKSEALKEKAEYDALMAQAGTKAASILENAAAQADLKASQIVASARQQADTIQKNAKDDIEREKAKAQAEMRSAITDVAIAAASQILGEEIDAQKQEDILNQVISDAGEGKW